MNPSQSDKHGFMLQIVLWPATFDCVYIILIILKTETNAAACFFVVEIFGKALYGKFKLV